MSRNKVVSSQNRGMMESVFKWGIIAVIFLVPLIYFPHRLLLFTASKTFFFMGCVDVLLCLWFWLGLRDSRYRPTVKNSLLFIPVGLFLISMTISGIVGVNPPLSFFAGLERGTGLVFLYHCFLFAMMLATVIRVQGRVFLKRILEANAGASVIMAIATFFTTDAFFTGSQVLRDSQNGAFLGNTSYTGAYFVFSVFLLLILIAVEQSKKRRVWYGLGLASILFSPIFFNVGIWKGAVSLSDLASSPALLLGQARMAAVSVGMGLVLAFFVWLATLQKRFGLRVLGAIGIAVVVVGTGIAAYQVTQPDTTVRQEFVEQGQNGRFQFWSAAAQGIQEKPLLGWGPENYHVVYQKYFDNSILKADESQEVFTDRPHNSFLELLVYGGIIGLGLYLGVLAVLIAGIIHLYRKRIISAISMSFLVGLVFAYILQNQLFFDIAITYILFFALIGSVTGLSCQENGSKPVVTEISSGKKILGVVVTIGVVLVWVWCAYMPARAMVKALLLVKAPLSERISTYDTILDYPGSYIIRRDFGYFTGVMTRSYNEKRTEIKRDPVRREELIQELHAALEATRRVWSDDTMDYRLAFSATTLVGLELYMTDTPTPEKIALCRRYAGRAMELSPADPVLYLVLSGCLIYDQKLDEAEALIDKALAMNPDIISAHRYKVRFEQVFGTDQEYRQAIKNAEIHFPDEQFELK
jgi:O-antigen ligase